MNNHYFNTILTNNENILKKIRDNIQFKFDNDYYKYNNIKDFVESFNNNYEEIFVAKQDFDSGNKSHLLGIMLDKKQNIYRTFDGKQASGRAHSTIYFQMDFENKIFEIDSLIHETPFGMIEHTLDSIVFHMVSGWHSEPVAGYLFNTQTYIIKDNNFDTTRYVKTQERLERQIPELKQKLVDLLNSGLEHEDLLSFFIGGNNVSTEKIELLKLKNDITLNAEDFSVTEFKTVAKELLFNKIMDTVDNKVKP